MFLAGYGGMVSLSQMTVAGVAGYMIAVIGAATAPISAWTGRGGRPFRCASPSPSSWRRSSASSRCAPAGIYTIMITLAIGVAFFYFTRQNYAIFNGHQRLRRAGAAGACSGSIGATRCPSTISASRSAVLSYGAVLYVARSHLRRSRCRRSATIPRRMNALGFHVNLHRVAAHAFAGFIAALGGVLWSGSTGASRRGPSTSGRSSTSW